MLHNHATTSIPASGAFRPRLVLLACSIIASLVTLAAFPGEARAQSSTIVAFGGSNTRGKGVSSSEAYPARLEALLRARGINATVVNAGEDGDTSRGMLARLDSAVPAGTKVVILHVSRRNDQRKRVSDRSANVAALKHALAARHIRIVMLEPEIIRAARRSDPQPDGVHIGPRGHAMIAARLLPRVIAALHG
jgi:acyl-CoA thioesterase-1